MSTPRDIHIFPTSTGPVAGSNSPEHTAVPASRWPWQPLRTPGRDALLSDHDKREPSPPVAGRGAACRVRYGGREKPRPQLRSKRGEGPELNNQPFIS